MRCPKQHRSAISGLPFALTLFSLALFPAAAKVTDQETIVEGPLPKPATIWVYDFVATPDALPSYCDLAKHYDHDAHVAQTEKEVKEGQKLGALLAHELVKQLKEMGMNAQEVLPDVKPEMAENDLILHGYLISFDEGDRKKRVVIGLGKGEAELHAVVEGFQVTPDGPRKLGRGETDTHSGRTPGGAVGAVTLVATKNPVGLIVSTGMKVHGERSGSSTVEGRAEKTGDEIAKVLKKRFEKQGWIKKRRRLFRK